MSVTDGQVGDGRATKLVVLTEVNAHIHEVVSESVAIDEEWEFFCECGAQDCSAQIALTAETFERLRVAGAAILAPGHQVDQRERSRALRADARALMAQAQHQTVRAQKNRDARVPDHA